MSQRVPFRTGDQALVREINLSLIMNRLHRHAPISRAALAEMTGLNKSTVSSLVNELIARKFVRELGAVSQKGIGRPSVQLELNPHAGYIVSAEIGVGFISVICTNFTANVLWECRESIPLELGQQLIIERALALMNNAVEAGKSATGTQPLLGIAFGLPGIIDTRDGTLLFAPNLRWRNLPIRDILQEVFPGVPIFVDNESNLGVLGEYFFGAAQGYDEVLYISAGIGLGGAVLHNGQLLRGVTGFAGEFGHMTLYPDGEACNCGNRGCWETRVSPAAMYRHIRREIERGVPTILSAIAAADLNLMHIVNAAQAADQVALEALERLGHDLGIGIASLVNVFNPDLVLVGGVLSQARDFIMPVVEQEIRARALKWSTDTVTLLPAKHGIQACVMGGVAAVYQTMLSVPGNTHLPVPA
ncbi:MAG: ROK family transcriptional regulator [Anaerolineae bacterium]|nr:ROK family transcriptional regulator [Anaerolineae bacterium]